MQAREPVSLAWFASPNISGLILDNFGNFWLPSTWAPMQVEGLVRDDWTSTPG